MYEIVASSNSRIIILKVQEHPDMRSELMDIRAIAGEEFIDPNYVRFHYETVKSKELTSRNRYHH